MNPFFLTSTSQPQPISGSSPNPSRPSIRRATPGDLLPLTDVLAESFHSREGLVGWVYPILRLGIYEDLRNRLTSSADYYVCLVAANSNSLRPQLYRPPTTTDTILGTVEMGLRSCNLSPGEPPQSWLASGSRQLPYLSNLAVHPQHRRLGVAQLLLSRCEAIAAQWGYSQVGLHVLDNNHAAKRLYFKAGYRLAEVDGGLNAFLFSQPKRLFLRKTLGS